MVADVMFSSEMGTWLTPKEIVDPLLQFAGEAGVGLDPSGHPNSLVKARHTCYGPEHGGEDGLSISWHDKGLTFNNPSYGRVILPAYAKKTEAEVKLGAEIISLVPARVETNWWRCYHRSMSCWVAWDGRIQFLDPEAEEKAKLLDACKLDSNWVFVDKDDQNVRLYKMLVKSKLLYENMSGDQLLFAISPTGMERDLRKPASAAFPSALIYSGPEKERFIRIFKSFGSVYCPRD